MGIPDGWQYEHVALSGPGSFQLMPWFSLSTGWQPMGPRPLRKRPRWYQAQPIDDPNSAAALDRFRKGLPEGHWLSNDTFGYLGRSLLDLTRRPYRA